jgi:hypothetical protein
VNYSIQTDAIKENIIPHLVSHKLASQVFANEADLLNVALFGSTAKMWREMHPDKEGNIRDYATLEQLVVLSNLESINALLIQQGLIQSDRLKQLNLVAISQLKTIIKSQSLKKLTTT